MDLEGYEKAQHQAAGHDGALVDKSGALFIKPTTQQEIDFYTQAYEQALRRDNDDPQDEGSSLTDWIPVFMGVLEPGITETVSKSQQVADEMKQLHQDQEEKGIIDKSKKYLVIENLLHGFKKPSIIDIKLGAVLHDENTPDEKRARLEDVSKSTTSGSLHYRVCGMKLHHDKIPNLDKFTDAESHITNDGEGYLTFDKWYGRALTPENMKENFRVFFKHNKLNETQQTIVLRNMFTRLQLLYNTLLSQEVRIRSGSVLFAYENDTQRWEEMENQDPIFKDDLAYDDDEEADDDDEDYALAPLSLLSLIDFAHAKFTPGEGHDEDVIIGVENLMNLLEQLLDE